MAKTIVVVTRDGFIPRLRSAARLVFGGQRTTGLGPVIAKERGTEIETSPTSKAYESMQEWEREFRRDAVVRASITKFAAFSVAKGFELGIEPNETLVSFTTPKERQEYLNRTEYVEARDWIDEINRKVHMRQLIRNAIIRRRIYGTAPYQIIWSQQGEPEQIVPLRWDSVKPVQDQNWRHTGWIVKTGAGREQTVPRRGRILYFANNSIGTDMVGLSDIEPILPSLRARRSIMAEALPEASRVLWAGQVLLQLDTSMYKTQEDAQRAADDVLALIKPGKTIVTSENIKNVQYVALDVHLERLIQTIQQLDTEITAALDVPRFLLNRVQEINRATAEKQFQAFVEGPIADAQEQMSDVLDEYWYDLLLHIRLRINVEKPAPVRIVHKWHPITFEDFHAMSVSVSRLWDRGNGLLQGNLKRGYELMHWPTEEVPSEIRQVPVGRERGEERRGQPPEKSKEQTSPEAQ